MRRALACLLPVACLAAADPDPATFIPGDAVLAARAPALARARERWVAAPYARMLQSAWGRTLLGEWGGRLDRASPAFAVMLGGLDSAALGVVAAPGRQPDVVVALAGRTEQLAAAIAPLLPEMRPGEAGTMHGPGGRATQHGTVLAWAKGPGGPVLPVGPARALGDAEADLELLVDLQRWHAVLGLPAAARADGAALRVDVRLDPLGLRESVEVPASDATRLAAVTVRRWADPDELRRLPGSTLWAATWNADPAVTLMDPSADAAVAQLERFLADAKLPGWSETLRSLDGPATVYMAEGMPFPTLTAALTMSEEVARRWITAAAAQLNLVQQDGQAAGFVGLLPCAIGWVADGAAGRLVLTTDPAGLDAWRQRKPGFAERAGVREVLAKVPERTLVLGAGRGGESWAALAQLAVPVFTAMGAPQAVSLPGDLRKASDRGWLYLQLGKDGTLRIDAAGLAGGPCSAVLAASIAVPATMWLQYELRAKPRGGRKGDPAPEAEPAAPQPAPVF